MSKNLRPGVPETANEKSVNIVKCLSAAAESVLPQKKRINNENEIWKNDSLLNSLLERRKTTAKASGHHKTFTKFIKKQVRRLKNEKMEKRSPRN